MHLLISVHLWRYEGGYPALTEVMSRLRDDKVELCDFYQHFLIFFVTSGLEFPFLSWRESILLFVLFWILCRWLCPVSCSPHAPIPVKTNKSERKMKKAAYDWWYMKKNPWPYGRDFGLESGCLRASWSNGI